MIIKHVFRSGNDCIVHIPEEFSDGFDLTHTEWERYPPSVEDMNEYLSDVYPNKVIPALEAVARRTRGPGYIFQIAPGWCVWQDSKIQ